MTQAATHAATHPVSTLAWGVGIARGVAAEVIRVASGQRGSAVPDQRSDTDRQPVRDEAPEQRQPQAAPVPSVAPVPAVEQRLPEPSRESFAHEPSPVSRDSGHTRSGSEAEVDDWLGDAELDLDPDADPAAGSVVEALEMGDRAGGDQVDHDAIKAVLSESEKMRRAATPPGDAS